MLSWLGFGFSLVAVLLYLTGWVGHMITTRRRERRLQEQAAMTREQYY